METRSSSKMSVNCYQTKWCHIPAEGSLTVVVIIHCEENQLCVCWGGFVNKAVANVTIENSSLLLYNVVVMFLLDCLTLNRRHYDPLQHQELLFQQYSATLHNK